MSLNFAPSTNIRKAGVMMYNAAIIGKNQKEVNVEEKSDNIPEKLGVGFWKNLITQ